jgi:tetraacyldisaccharide 4'-kinase
MSFFLERQWYRPSLTWITRCLMPLSWIFGAVVGCRRFLYRFNFKKSHVFSIPIIVVGNITVGGTGKTPCVIWLAKLFSARGYQPGIVSRGVGGKKQLTAYRVTQDADVNEVGDEAVLLAKRTQCPVVVCIDRVAAVQDLLAHTSCNVVISDDGLQHYRMARNVEIAVIDGMRDLGNQCLLPAGPLREPVSRLQTVDFVLRQGTAPQRGMNAYSFVLHGEFAVSVKNEMNKIPLHQFATKRIHAVAAIGNPSRFFDSLREQGFNVVEHIFPDHYLFTKEDFVFSESLPILMTEKDAVKCVEFADERFWYVPVDVQFDKDFSEQIVRKMELFESDKSPRC